MPEIAPFKGFSKATLKFYENITKNNSKDWFEAHRDEYMRDVITPAKSFIVDAGAKLQKLSPGIGADPDHNGKGSFKKIHTDQRFVKDRDPFKTYMDIMFWEGPVGAKKDNSAFYLRVLPKQVMLVAGIKFFNNDVLKLYRKQISDPKNAAALASILKKLEAEGYSIGGRAGYKSVPRGMTIDEKHSDLALHDGACAFIELPVPAEFETAKFADFCIAHWKKMLPLHKWLVEMLAA